MKMFRIILLMMGVSTAMFAQRQALPSFTLPPDHVALFGNGFVSTFVNERDFALSPDGRELYFTISTPKSSIQTIVFCKRTKGGTWTSPEVVSFAGEYSDLEPVFSADGQTLYFASNRPLVNNAAPKDFDIWKVSRVGEGWGKPENLGTPINTRADEFYPSIAKNNNLYYTAAYSSGVGKEDIYVSVFADTHYQQPVPLDTAINSTRFEFNAFVSPDEQFIIFSSFGRKDDTGGGDLYLSVKDESGNWQPAKNLKALNSRQLDYCPFVTPDGKALFFTSERHQLPVSFTEPKATYKSIKEVALTPLNGSGNIYWVSFAKVLEEFNKTR